jgi:hypothetical protein
VLNLNQSEQIDHLAGVLEQCFSNDKPSGKRPFLFRQLREHSFQIIQVVVLEPPNDTTRSVYTLPNGEIDSTVCDDNVASLAKGRDHATDGRETLRIDDGAFGPVMRRDVPLQVEMDVEGAVEACCGAWAGAVFSKCLDCAVDEFWVAGEVVVVVASEICDGSAITQFRSRSGRCVPLQHG